MVHYCVVEFPSQATTACSMEIVLNSWLVDQTNLKFPPMKNYQKSLKHLCFDPDWEVFTYRMLKDDLGKKNHLYCDFI